MEKVAKKKARRAPKKWVVLALVCLLAAACGAAVALLRRPAGAPVLPDKEPAPVLWAFERVADITVTPESGEAYTLVARDDSLWLSDEPSMTLRSSAVQKYLNAAEKMEAEFLVLDMAQEDASPADFGLAPARAQARVTDADGQSAALLIGGPVPEETPMRYCMLAGDSRVYAVLESLCEPFFFRREYLPAFEQPSLKGELMDAIDVTGAYTLSMRYTQSGWLMSAPVRYPVSQVKSDYILSMIEQMAFESYLGEMAAMDLTVYGLASPELTVRLTQAASVISGETQEGESVSLNMPEKEYTLLLGAETGQSGVYVGWQGGVYKASNFLLGFWKTLSLRELPLQKPVNFLTNNLTAVRVRAPGVEGAYTVAMVEGVTDNNEVAVDEYGRTLFDLAAWNAKTGEAVDAQAFADWYLALSALTGAGTLPADYTPEGEAIGEIVLTNETMTRTITFYAYDALHAAMGVDGTYLYYIEKDFFQSIAPAP